MGRGRRPAHRRLRVRRPPLPDGDRRGPLRRHERAPLQALPAPHRRGSPPSGANLPVDSARRWRPSSSGRSARRRTARHQSAASRRRAGPASSRRRWRSSASPRSGSRSTTWRSPGRPPPSPLDLAATVPVPERPSRPPLRCGWLLSPSPQPAPASPVSASAPLPLLHLDETLPVDSVPVLRPHPALVRVRAALQSRRSWPSTPSRPRPATDRRRSPRPADPGAASPRCRPTCRPSPSPRSSARASAPVHGHRSAAPALSGGPWCSRRRALILSMSRSSAGVGCPTSRPSSRIARPMATCCAWSLDPKCSSAKRSASGASRWASAPPA